MRASPKEKLNNKSNKMVDLILDEIEDGGSKTITAGFTSDKEKKSYILTVGITVADIAEEIITQNVCENCSCNMQCNQTNNSAEQTNTTESSDDSSVVENPQGE